MPLPAGSGNAEFRQALSKKLLPAAREFRPDFVLVSAGFDAHEDDPLANMRMSTQGFGLMTARIQKAANELCRGRLISMLEGGYNHEALSESVQIHLENLMAGTH